MPVRSSDGQQLGIGQGCGATGQQFFAGLGFGGQVLDGHGQGALESGGRRYARPGLRGVQWVCRFLQSRQFIGTQTTTTACPRPTVQPGSFFTLHYRLAGPAGDVINTFNDKPATLSLGAGELSPALEQRLLGLAEGTRTTFDLPAGEAFGERNPDMAAVGGAQAAQRPG